MSQIFSYLYARAQERSTWLGAVALLGALGVGITPDQAQTITTVGVGLVGAIFAGTADRS